VEGIEAFKEFYEAETKHRKLTWVYTQIGFIKVQARPWTWLNSCLAAVAGLARVVSSNAFIYRCTGWQYLVWFCTHCELLPAYSF
jgi:hypothetical protein